MQPFRCKFASCKTWRGQTQDPVTQELLAGLRCSQATTGRLERKAYLTEQGPKRKGLDKVLASTREEFFGKLPSSSAPSRIARPWSSFRGLASRPERLRVLKNSSPAARSPEGLHSRLLELAPIAYRSLEWAARPSNARHRPGLSTAVTPAPVPDCKTSRGLSKFAAARSQPGYGPRRADS